MFAALPLAFGLLALLTLAVLLHPVLRRSGSPTDRIEAEMDVCRAQLDEIARDRELGTIDEEAARAAELEVKRRMLALDRRRGEIGSSWQPGRRLVGAVVALLVPAGAFLLYAQLGRPDLPDLPITARDLPRGDQPAVAGGDDPNLPSVEEMVAGLERRLAEKPDDVQGWLMLARSRMALGRYTEAADAYRRVKALEPELHGIDSALGEALVVAAEGVVPPAAREAFEAELARNPGDPRALFYLALAAEQAGDFARALDGYVELGRQSPTDAPWLPQLRDRIAAVAAELGRDPEPVLAEIGKAAGTAAGADGGGEAERLEQQLAARPKDWQGWIRLARLRAAEGDLDAARTALERGREVYAGAPFVLQQMAAAERELGLDQATAGGGRGPSPEDIEAAQAMTPEEQQAMIASMVERLAERLRDQPDDVEGWRMLARSYRVLGRTEDAVGAFRHLAERLPQDVQAQLDYAVALLETVPPGSKLPETVVAAFEHVRALDPDQPDALFYLGLAAQQNGDKATAREFWTRLLAALPPDTPAHAEVARRLEALGAS